ncbi:hypothetical protein NLX86_15645 [Streptomyces sp. A3M-1-3]|uniref:hypothetical protein n=1 Tax=Streptomyces sp. A3M-1-3 TaxID=2962044 RepID=UPI0020B72AAD|nr:hypothetical protein [Streptomyces sp. A3M-1-3]MCP3819485.1 hypothetical protein [Streptomyces sp. A3M-1-3]
MTQHRMSTHSRSRRGSVVLATLLLVAALVSAGVFMGVSGASGSQDRPAAHPRALWVGTWSASPAAAESGTHGTGTHGTGTHGTGTHGTGTNGAGTNGAGHAGRTFRNVIHTSIGGSRVRVTLSNLFGVRPLRIGHASIALAAAPDPRKRPAAAPGTLHPLTFGGSPGVTIPAGGEITSDAARLPVPADADVLVSTYAPRSAAPAGPVTYHPRARQTSYAAAGDHTQVTGADAYT